MKSTIVSILIGTFSTVSKKLLKGSEERVETTQATAYLRTARILKKVLEI